MKRRSVRVALVIFLFAPTPYSYPHITDAAKTRTTQKTKLKDELSSFIHLPLKTTTTDLSFLFKTITVMALFNRLYYRLRSDILSYQTSSLIEGSSFLKQLKKEKPSFIFLETITATLQIFLMWYFLKPLRKLIQQQFYPIGSLHDLITRVQEKKQFLSPQEIKMLLHWYNNLKKKLSSHGIGFAKIDSLSDTAREKLFTISPHLATMISQAEHKKAYPEHGGFVTAIFNLALHLDTHLNNNVTTKKNDNHHKKICSTSHSQHNFETKAFVTQLIHKPLKRKDLEKSFLLKTFMFVAILNNIINRMVEASTDDQGFIKGLFLPTDEADRNTISRLMHMFSPLILVALAWHFFKSLKRLFKSSTYNPSIHDLITNVRGEKRFLSQQEITMLASWYKKFKKTFSLLKTILAPSSSLATSIAISDQTHTAYQNNKNQESFMNFITSVFNLAYNLNDTLCNSEETDHLTEHSA